MVVVGVESKVVGSGDDVDETVVGRMVGGVVDGRLVVVQLPRTNTTARAMALVRTLTNVRLVVAIGESTSATTSRDTFRNRLTYAGQMTLPSLS